MKKYRTLKKVERLQHIELILLQHPDGVTVSDLYKRFATNRSTIYRDLDDLSVHSPVSNEAGRWFIDKMSYLTNIRLTIYEMQALHLSTRLFVNSMRFPFPHGASALRKMGEAYKNVSSVLSGYLTRSADEFESMETAQYDRYRSIIEKITIAITEKRISSIRYFVKKRNRDETRYIIPLWLEPYAAGKSVYLIAYENEKKDFRTFKIERIKHVETTDGCCDISYDELVRKAFSRFSSAWGSDVRICEPEYLREKHIEDLKKGLRGYGITKI